MIDCGDIFMYYINIITGREVNNEYIRDISMQKEVKLYKAVILRQNTVDPNHVIDSPEGGMLE